MKKIQGFAIILIIGVAVSQVSAQVSSTYIYFKPIYAFPGTSQMLETNEHSIGNTTYSKGVYGSFATGLSLQAGIAKMINTNFGFDIAAEWLDGNGVKSTYSVDTGALVSNGEGTDKIKSFMLKPMFILRNSGDLLTFYSKLGIVIAVYSQGTSSAYFSQPDSALKPQLFNVTEVTKVKPKVGFVAAFGIAARVSQAIALTLEVSGQMLSLPETSGYYSQLTQNGVNQLNDPNFTPYYKTWNYKKEIVEIDNHILTPEEKQQPSTRLYSPLNFSYIGVSIGIRYYL